MTDNLDIIKAPWTKDQVDALRKWQLAGFVHPYTCANNDRDDHGEDDTLIPTINGWICPYCDYRQDWASKVMFVFEDIHLPKSPFS